MSEFFAPILIPDLRIASGATRHRAIECANLVGSPERLGERNVSSTFGFGALPFGLAAIYRSFHQKTDAQFMEFAMGAIE